MQGFLTTDSDQAREYFDQAGDAFGKACKEVDRCLSPFRTLLLYCTQARRLSKHFSRKKSCFGCDIDRFAAKSMHLEVYKTSLVYVKPQYCPLILSFKYPPAMTPLSQSWLI